MPIKETTTEISALSWCSSFTNKSLYLKAFYSFEASGPNGPVTDIFFQKHGYFFHKITKYN